MIVNDIAIRSIQHYLYCPHRWGLLEVDRAWAENFFVTRANLMHERVHDPKYSYAARGRKVFTSVPVYQDQEEYQLYGVLDCLELIPDPDGISVKGCTGTYRLCIVEYKPTKPKNKDFREDDLMQVFAQKLCTDFVFGGNCEGALYYGDVKKRVLLPLKENKEELECRLKQILREMRWFLAEGKIPSIRKGQQCSGCSMKDLCMPAVKQTLDLRKEIQKIERTVL